MSRDWPIVIGGIRQTRTSPYLRRPIVLHELKHPPRRTVGLIKQLRWSLVDSLFVLLEVSAICLVLLLAYAASTLPDPDVFQASLASNEAAVGRVTSHAIPVRLADLPHFLPDSVIKIEGDAFYQPMPVDLLELISVLSGLSKAAQDNATIAQRLAASLLPQGRLGDLDILRQWMLGLRIESHYTREQLLEIYLNRASFGDGVVGVDDAAHRYFGKEARALTSNQSVQLAALVDRSTHVEPGQVAGRTDDHAAHTLH